MDLTRSQYGTAAGKTTGAILPQQPVSRTVESTARAEASAPARKTSYYGLPCAKCRLYYSADLDHCPTCHGTERVSPVATAVPARIANASAEPLPDLASLEQEREEFLRQFKSQLFEAHSEVVNTVASTCTLSENHPGESDKAEICKSCYDRLQERLDVCEGALHIDLKEAAQIVYDAVWADASDPSKTYQNAASALLTELRKRSGLSTLLGPFHPLTH
jgi:hypothetical protein